jgi:hypothetical protein
MSRRRSRSLLACLGMCEGTRYFFSYKEAVYRIVRCSNVVGGLMAGTEICESR